MRKITLILSILVFTLASTTLKAQNAGAAESKQNSGSTGGDVGPTVVDTSKSKATKPYSATNSGAVSKAHASALNSPTSSNAATQNTAKAPATSSDATANGTSTSNANNTDSSLAITDSTNSSTAAATGNNTCNKSCNWGWLGLLGLLGLFGLAGKRKPNRV